MCLACVCVVYFHENLAHLPEKILFPENIFSVSLEKL